MVPEVAGGQARPVRRTFTVAQKLDILDEYDHADALGRGALLRREKIYTSTISQWRQAKARGRYDGDPPARGPAPKPAAVKRVEQLEAETARLQAELDVARQVVKVQGELAALLETLSASSATRDYESRPRR
jgi:hypothetical protein